MKPDFQDEVSSPEIDGGQGRWPCVHHDHFCLSMCATLIRVGSFRRSDDLPARTSQGSSGDTQPHLLHRPSSSLLTALRVTFLLTLAVILGLFAGLAHKLLRDEEITRVRRMCKSGCRPKFLP